MTLLFACTTDKQESASLVCSGVTLINDFEAQGRGIALLKLKPNLVTQSIADVGKNGLQQGTDVITLYQPKALKKEEPISAIKPKS